MIQRKPQWIAFLSLAGVVAAACASDDPAKEPGEGRGTASEARGTPQEAAPALQNSPVLAAAKTGPARLPLHAIRDRKFAAAMQPKLDPTLRARFVRARQEAAEPSHHVAYEDATPVAYNPEQALGIRYEAERVVLAPRLNGEESAARTAALRFGGIGRAGKRTLPPVLERHVDGARVEYERPGVEEWYANGPLGLEQGFTIAAAPAGTGQVELTIATSGSLRPSLGEQGSYVTLQDAGGQAVLQVRELFVEDARGRVLPSRFSVHGAEVLVTFDDSGATYPVTVDPLVATFTNTVFPNDGQFDGFFGWSVDMEGSRAVVGAPLQDGKGAAYVFVRSGGTWTQEQKLTFTWVGLAPFDPPLFFGYAVSISGSTIAVGAPLTAQTQLGTVQIFTRSGTTWSLQASKVGYDRHRDRSNLFGFSLDLDGDKLAVGAPDGGEEAAGNNAGDVYLLTRSGTTWSTQVLTQLGNTLDFGSSVALKGQTVIVGAPGSPSTDLGGIAGAGRAMVYQQNAAGAWARQQTLLSPSPEQNGAFGAAVALAGISTTGGTALVGEPGSSPRGSTSGGARVFRRSGVTWTAEAHLFPTAAATGNRYGDSLALSFASSGGVTRNVAVLGAPASNRPPVIFARSSAGSWSQQSTVAEEALANRCGNALWLDFNDLLVATPLSIAGGAVFSNSVNLSNGEACTSASHCASGFCVDGVCCNSLCGNGATDCQACSRAQNGTTNGTCTPLRSARECRRAEGPCDAAESCSTSSRTCPTDRKKASGTPCGTIPSPNENGVAECTGFDVCTRHCDVTEVCNGSANSCPTNAFKPAGYACRSTNQFCDPVEECTGAGGACPEDVNLCL